MKKFLIGLLSLLLLLPNISLSAVKLATLINPNGVKIVVVAGSQTAQQYFGDGFVLYQGEPMLGFTVVTNYKTTLSRSISSTASTIYVSSLTTKDGHSLTMADLGTKVFFTLEPGSNKEEIVMCTGVGTLSWNSCTRGLLFYATSTSAVTANQKSHSAGSAIVMSNVHYVYDQLVNKDVAETIDGQKTFTATTTFSTLPNTTTSYTPAADGDLATKKYVDDTSFAGGTNATESVKGISELSTKAEAALGTSAGATAARLVLPASMATSTSQVATTSIPITNTSGKLDTSFIDQTTAYTWSGDNTFSGQNTFSASSTMASTSVDHLYVNDILGDSNFGNGASTLHFHPYNFGVTSTTTVGLQTIAHGLGITPRKIKITAYGGIGVAGNVIYQSVGVSTQATTTQNVVYFTATGEYGNSTGNTTSGGDEEGSIVKVDSTGKLWSMDATNFVINWTAITAGTVRFLWEAEY